MTKRFFVVVPYSPIEDKKWSFFSRLGSVFTPAKVIKLNQTKFEKYLNELNQRIEHVSMNISSMGVTTVRLDTQGLIELYYNVYNPTVSAKQKLNDIEKLRVESSSM